MSKVTFNINITPFKETLNGIVSTVKDTVSEVIMEQLAYAQERSSEVIYDEHKPTWYVRTGNLGRSYNIFGEWSGSEYYASLSNRADYFTYVEQGTGIYHANGRRTVWAYQTADKKWHWTKGMEARNSFGIAFDEMKDDIIPYMEYRLNEAMKGV